MQLITVAVFGTMMFAAASAMMLPEQEAAFVRTQTDIEASAFVSYRNGVAKYIAANPGTPTGVISAPALAPYMPAGVPVSSKYTNYWLAAPSGAVGAGLYVYSIESQSNGVLQAIAKKAGQPITMGAYWSGSPSTLSSKTDMTFTMPVPTIPGVANGAAVMYGH